MLGIKVEEPEWIGLDNFNSTEVFEEALDDTIKKLKGTPLQIVLMMLPHENLYPKYKKICYSRGLLSQVLAFKSFSRFNHSIASNVLRQMNSKIGGDLYNLKFDNSLNPFTMLVGIDVCHSGSQSIVGFCATINKQLSQYYSERIAQNRNQEIVDDKLKNALKRALDSYIKLNG